VVSKSEETAPGLLCSVRCTTRLPVAQKAIWERVITPEGINDEIWPVIRMTVPRGLDGVTIDDVTPPATLGRSWFLAGGVLPIDYDMITIAALEPPEMFLEHSTMLTFSDWVHERRVQAVTAETSVLEDHVSWRGRGAINRSALLRRSQVWLLSAMFRHRHKRLAKHFRCPIDAPVVEVVAPHDVAALPGAGAPK
jgi:hypothetical protein